MLFGSLFGEYVTKEADTSSYARMQGSFAEMQGNFAEM